MRHPILTPRLILRDIVETDAEPLFELDTDPVVMRYIGPRPADTVTAYRDRFRDVYQPWQSHPWHGLRIVLDRSSSDFLGWVFIRPATASKNACGLQWSNPSEVEIGYRYHRHAWGRGLATEAARPLLLDALADAETTGVVATAHIDNIGSLRVLEKLGLQRFETVTLPDIEGVIVKLILRK